MGIMAYEEGGVDCSVVEQLHLPPKDYGPTAQLTPPKLSDGWLIPDEGVSPFGFWYGGNTTTQTSAPKPVDEVVKVPEVGLSGSGVFLFSILCIVACVSTLKVSAKDGT